MRARFAEVAARIQQGSEETPDLKAIRVLLKRLFAQFVIYPFDKVPDGVPIHDVVWDVESQRVVVPITEPAVTLGIRVQIGGYAWQAVPGHGLAPQVRPILKKQVLGGSW